MRFLPRKYCRRHRGRIRSFPADDRKKSPHLTAFIGYKAGMTHILRTLKKPNSKAHEKDIVEAVTIVETPPISIVGLVGYVKTPAGLRSITTVWAAHIDDSFRRRFYKNWRRSKKQAFTKWQKMFADSKSGETPKEVERRLLFIKQYADVVRVIAHSQVKKLKHIGMKKAHIMEIQVNGGNIEDKVSFGYNLFEKEVRVGDVFAQNQIIDTIAVTRGHGWKGVVNRWGVTRLQRKTHRGNRKVACIGSWHPSRVDIHIARAGQKGYHHRTELHKKIYRVGDAIEYGEDGKAKAFNAQTPNDLSEKNITPLGGFPNYGVVKQDFLMIKGSCPGPRKRPITMRLPIVMPSGTGAEEEIELKFIDTSSQMGHGRFQTKAEKQEYFGPTKKEKARADKEKSDARAAKLRAIKAKRAEATA
jgi:large subunit ribosomal protein L3e